MRFWRWITLAASIVSFAATAFLVSWLENPYGRCSASGACVEREYYLYAPSSQAKIVESVRFADSFFLTGEKSTFRFASEDAATAYVRDLLEEENAAVVLEEAWGSAQSVYAFSPRRENGIRLSCGRVNLHIVLQGACVQVGTPMIFGGY